MPGDQWFDRDVRPWVKFEGEVEIRYGDGRKQDLLNYMDNDKEFLEYEGEFDPDMFKKDMKRNEQTILWCHPCSCEQKQMGTLITHISGKKHVNKVSEFRRLQQGFERAPPQQPRAKKAKTQLPSERDASCSLTELLQRYPTDPALGLKYVHEWNPPDSNRGGVKWYTCTQKGCKSAWGKSFEMCAHLIGNKNKHNRNFLANHGYPDADGFTQDKLLAKAREVDQYERGDFELVKQRDYSAMNRHFNDHRMYRELSTRPKEWSESKEEQKRVREQRRLQQYKGIMGLYRKANYFRQNAEKAMDETEVTSKTLEFIKSAAESSLKSLDLAKLMAQKLHAKDEKESAKSKDLKVRPKLTRTLAMAKFKLDVNRFVRTYLKPYFINPEKPEMVRIPSKAKFNAQVNYLSYKVIRGEVKKKENDMENIKVHSVTLKNIKKLVDDNMTKAPGFEPLEQL